MNLPREIREMILSFCVLDAISQSKIVREKTKGIRPRVANLALTLWPEPPGETKLIFEGINNLPLLFTNKQIFAEVSKLVYSNLSELLISPQFFLYINENPYLRWDEQILSLLRQNFPNNDVIKIQMPSMAEDLHGEEMFWGDQSRKFLEPILDSWEIALGLERFLKEFSNVPGVEVIISVDLYTLPPDFRKLLPIYDIVGKKMVVPKLFEVEPEFVEQAAKEWEPVIVAWSKAWDNCLRKHGRR